MVVVCVEVVFTLKAAYAPTINIIITTTTIAIVAVLEIPLIFLLKFFRIF